MKTFGLTEEKVMGILNGNELKTGMLKYKTIMDMVQYTDVSHDKEFHKKYNGFYRMRQRPKEYYEMYYTYMERCKKDKELRIDDIATYIYNKTQRCELSFSSKLLATINPNMPVWDTIVAQNHFGISYTVYTPKKYVSRLEMIIDKYHEYTNVYLEYMNGEEAKMIVRLFDEVYPNINITDVKKVDLVLWKDR